MRIALVSEHASPLATLGGVDAGGQNVHVEALAAGLAGRGHEVVVYTRRDRPDLPARIDTTRGYAVEHVPAGPATEIPKDEIWPSMGEFGDWLAERWSRDRPDIAHAHFWMSGAATLDAARRHGVPVVQTFHALGSVKRRHQGAADTSPADRLGVERRICASVDHVIATCTEEVAELAALGMDRGRATVIPCGVDTKTFTPTPPPNARPYRLLAVARPVERKGVDDTVRALAGLPDAELVVVGGPSSDALDLDPEVARLRAVAAEAGVGDRLHLVGAVARADMPAMFAAANVVVATPWYEPFGMVPLEAMASGRPVVGTAVGGLLDTVVPGVTGELVRPRCPAELTAALRALLDDPCRRAAYGAAGAARARTTYDWPAVVVRTDEVLTAVQRAHETLEVTR